MDPQYESLSHKIDDLAHKIDALATTVTNLQVQSGDGTVKFRVETAEREIGILFERGREQERALQTYKEEVDEKLIALDRIALRDKTFWKTSAWIASGAFAVFMVVVDIALRIAKL